MFSSVGDPGQLDFHTRMKFSLYKNNSKLIKNLNIRTKL